MPKNIEYLSASYKTSFGTNMKEQQKEEVDIPIQNLRYLKTISVSPQDLQGEKIKKDNETSIAIEPKKVAKSKTEILFKEEFTKKNLINIMNSYEDPITKENLIINPVALNIKKERLIINIKKIDEKTIKEPNIISYIRTNYSKDKNEPFIIRTLDKNIKTNEKIKISLSAPQKNSAPLKIKTASDGTKSSKKIVLEKPGIKIKNEKEITKTVLTADKLPQLKINFKDSFKPISDKLKDTSPFTKVIAKNVLLVKSSELSQLYVSYKDKFKPSPDLLKTNKNLSLDVGSIVNKSIKSTDINISSYNEKSDVKTIKISYSDSMKKTTNKKISNNTGKARTVDCKTNKITILDLTKTIKSANENSLQPKFIFTLIEPDSLTNSYVNYPTTNSPETIIKSKSNLIKYITIPAPIYNPLDSIEPTNSTNTIKTIYSNLIPSHSFSFIPLDKLNLNDTDDYVLSDNSNNLKNNPNLYKEYTQDMLTPTKIKIDGDNEIDFVSNLKEHYVNLSPSYLFNHTPTSEYSIAQNNFIPIENLTKNINPKDVQADIFMYNLVPYSMTDGISFSNLTTERGVTIKEFLVGLFPTDFTPNNLANYRLSVNSKLANLPIIKVTTATNLIRDYKGGLFGSKIELKKPSLNMVPEDANITRSTVSSKGVDNFIKNVYREAGEEKGKGAFYKVTEGIKFYYDRLDGEDYWKNKEGERQQISVDTNTKFFDSTFINQRETTNISTLNNAIANTKTIKATPPISQNFNKEYNDIDLQDYKKNRMVPFESHQKFLAQRNSIHDLGYIAVFPSSDPIKNFKIPFQFNPKIVEGGVTANYAATSFLGRIGAIQTYVNTSALTSASIEMNYFATVKEVTTSREDWLDCFSVDVIQNIESLLRSLIYPDFGERPTTPTTTNPGNKFEFSAPPLIRVLIGSDSNTTNFFRYPSPRSFTINGTEASSYRNFLVTSLTIVKDLDTPLYMKSVANGGQQIYDSIGFSAQMSLVEVTPNYKDILPDYRDYYNSGKNLWEGTDNKIETFKSFAPR